jgi:hypothetical protein
VSNEDRHETPRQNLYLLSSGSPIFARPRTLVHESRLWTDNSLQLRTTDRKPERGAPQHTAYAPYHRRDVSFHDPSLGQTTIHRPLHPRFETPVLIIPETGRGMEADRDSGANPALRHLHRVHRSPERLCTDPLPLSAIFQFSLVFSDLLRILLGRRNRFNNSTESRIRRICK